MEKKVLVTGGSGFIGSYLIGELSKKEFSILNVDINPPIEPDHLKYWRQLDILSATDFTKAVVDFKPEYVIHLAARTDTNPTTTFEEYRVNYDGTAILLDAIKHCSSVERTIITSTQFVNQYNGVPKHDLDFAPHTVYGETKVLAEKLTREANLNCFWTIVRPTNIWGPRHPRYPSEFWKVLKTGRYIHPGNKPVVRSYGYVGNVVDQIINILEAKPETIHQQVLYVGDHPINLYDWVNGFSLALNQRNVRVVPRFVVKSLAVAGEILQKVNLKFPITLSRYQSMTHSNSVPMEKTYQVLGAPKHSLEYGIAETVKWLQEQDES
jgi:nucleoside-diphosphate-sugar epimerase